MKYYLNLPPALAQARQVQRANQEAELGFFDAWEAEAVKSAKQLQERRRADSAVKYVRKDK